MEAHRIGCQKRPIEAGDYVRWAFGGREDDPDWCEGVATVIRDRKVRRMTVERVHNWPGALAAMQHSEFVCPDSDEHGPYGSVRRIPRPEQAQGRRVFPRGADRTLPCPTCTRPWGEHYGVACALPRMEGYESGRVCSTDCQCGAHTSPPAPALVDGLDREQCLARWMENRLTVEGGAAPPNVLTPEQIAAGRALWLERYGAARSAELRERLAADEEAERNRVTYGELDADD